MINLSGSVINKDHMLSCIKLEAERKIDQIIVPDQLKFSSTESNWPALRIEVDEVPVSLYGHAYSQLLERLKIPARFFENLSVDLRSKILTETNEKRKWKRTYLFRKYLSEDKTVSFVRAIMTSAYNTAMDDHKTFPVIIEELEKHNPSYDLLVSDGGNTSLTVRFNNTKVIHEGIDIQAGIFVANSEVGDSKLWIEPAIFIGNSIPGTVIHSHDECIDELGFTHLYSSFTEENVRKAVNRAIELGQIGIIQYLENASEHIEANTVLTEINKLQMPVRFRNMVRDQINTEEWLTKKKVTDAVMEAARDLPIMEKIRAANYSSNLLGVFTGAAERLKKMLQEDEKEEDKKDTSEDIPF